MAINEKIWAIVPAAGAGTRMQSGVPKQYLPLLGRPVILHTLERLCSYPRVRGVLVGIAPGDSHWSGLGADKVKNLLGTFDGGASRARTVLNGLAALSAHAQPEDWVMVHDAMRPCLRHADLDRLSHAAFACADGALLATPVADTVKRGDAHGRVCETVSRAGLWRALTPQMFPLGKLSDALSAALRRDEDVTDDSAAMERLGAHPMLVEGHADNIKITHPGDLALAELFLKRQANENA
ncbi:MAG TPA: 2-C-methyl-D-erythritol 4-phosphate cytidylyltransferase [Burkholderiales bacterium]